MLGQLFTFEVNSLNTSGVLSLVFSPAMAAIVDGIDISTEMQNELTMRSCPSSLTPNEQKHEYPGVIDDSITALSMIDLYRSTALLLSS